MLKIIVPDPGLSEHSGHHPAMFESLVSSRLVTNGDIEFDFYSSQNVFSSFVNANRDIKNVKLVEYFKTDFYQYFYQDLNLFDMNDYINHLTKEYLKLFEQYRTYSERDILFLYHTLHWEHALALASAISIFERTGEKSFQHCAFLMFTPRKYDDHEQLLITRYLNFKLAFSLLAKHNNVDCYVGDYELKREYQSFLTRPVKIHPCGLINTENLGSKNNSTGQKKRLVKSVILFTGDAKTNKGFLEVPRMLEALTQQFSQSEFRFVVQYTLTNQKPELIETELQLQRLALNDKRIELVARFWSEEELHDSFSNAFAILFNYESKAYQNQSSGVLWLAAYYQLKMLFFTNTWLNREAERLSCDYKYCNLDNWLAVMKIYIEESEEIERVKNENAQEAINGYWDELFQNILPWLNNKYNKNKEITC